MALDCEMDTYLIIAENRHVNLVINCAIVNMHGEVLFDQVMNPWQKGLKLWNKRITYGIHKISQATIRAAPKPSFFKQELEQLLKTRTIIGHTLISDLKVIYIPDFYPYFKRH